MSGILDGKSALIVAPTATGKSFIGREAICRAIARGEKGVHAYLVPFRALAREVFESFVEDLAGTNARVRIVTGDHRDPVRPEEADLVVATYESFIGLLARANFQPCLIVADEIHLIADDHRGPAVEGMFARLLASGRAPAICALSAVIENPADLATWLAVPLIKGTAKDRPVPLKIECKSVEDLDEGLATVLSPCRDGEQALIFCRSKSRAVKTARWLAEGFGKTETPGDGDFLARAAGRVLEADPKEKELADLLVSGVAYHHAGLSKPIRVEIEQAFRARKIKILAGTTTLAAGVNLPAGIAVVRDVWRMDSVRSTFRPTLIPSGEILNMLGRAGRPFQRTQGLGIALVEKGDMTNDEVKELVAAVREGRGGAVRSRLPKSFESIMRFVLAVVVESGDASREAVARAFSKTFAYYLAPVKLLFRRSFEEDIMEDIPAYQKVVAARGDIRMKSYGDSPHGIRVAVLSSDHHYEVTIGISGMSCTCPAASKYYRRQICKHQACAIHALLFTEGIRDEIRWRAIYNCGHIFGQTLDLDTRLNLALEILNGWKLIERSPGGWRSTLVGQVAAASGFDLLFVHQVIERIASADRADYEEVISWAVEDFFADGDERKRWMSSLRQWLREADERDISLPTKYRGVFERGTEDLSRVCVLYEKGARALGKSDLAEAALHAAGAVRYGVAPELVPLMALGFPQLGRARGRLLFEAGIRDVKDLAVADPRRVADPKRMPEGWVRNWVQRADDICRARTVASADGKDADAEFDELVVKFRLDPAALA
jgi:replicative superfamily II helicase